MIRANDLIVEALLIPASVRRYSDQEWDLLIRQGRRTRLLALLAYRLKQADLMNEVPQAPQLHLHSAMQLASRQNVSLRWEIACICRELAQTEVKVVLLKGAAYAMANLPTGVGRSFSDIDIIVPKAKIDLVESELMLHGWQGGDHDAYDQRYYRQWMHEIPPLTHIGRGTTIDVHHAILPETARVKVNSIALMDGITPINGVPGVYTLAPIDMLLHSATHLFHEGDFEKGLRDLFDLDSLFRHFGGDAMSWNALVPRAKTLGLTRPLYYAIRYTSCMLGTPVPDQVIEDAKVGQPPLIVRHLMDICYLRALRPLHESTDSYANWSARFVLYVRSHWIRMPFYLLAYHLGRKVFTRQKEHVKASELAETAQPVL